jgi:hypothetical protein
MTTMSVPRGRVIGDVTNARPPAVGGFHNAPRRLERVSFQRGIDSGDPGRREPVAGEHELRIARTRQLGVGTLACPECDAPVALAGPVAPADLILCPYCWHDAAVRDFLSLEAPTRPARVVVTVTDRARTLQR